MKVLDAETLTDLIHDYVYFSVLNETDDIGCWEHQIKNTKKALVDYLIKTVPDNTHGVVDEHVVV